MHSPDPRREIRREALAAGFDRVGFARAGPAPHAKRFREWLARGFAGPWITWGGARIGGAIRGLSSRARGR